MERLPMRLKYKKQDFQIDAVNAVAELFQGQLQVTSVFGVNKVDIVDYADGDLCGYGNRLTINKEKIQANLHAVQERNLLTLTDIGEEDGGPEYRFNIEMETGTGKTFVYIKTIFELNKLYGFNKFVILVPSVAIREGVYHSLKATEAHFAQEYDGKRAHYFIYKSEKLNEVRNFALSSTLEIMIVTIGAINKDANIFNRENDRMDKTARQFMAECRPVMIIDEPQTTDNTPIARTAIRNLDPLFELRYSATHREKINTIYRLTPVDAYEKKIVKQICVASESVAGDHNKPYIRLIEVGKNIGFYANVEIDIRNTKTGFVKRETKIVSVGDDLKKITGRDIYDGYEIEGIDCTPCGESIEFRNTETLELGKSLGNVDEIVMKREQIKTTIQIHLEKELRYLKQGIKVLSLFFIDEVVKYRDYEATDMKGIYASIFEKEYNKLIMLPKFTPIREQFPQNASDVHNGYFSADKKGLLKDTNGDSKADDSTYNLIMTEKEKLLSFDTPLRFIFSHSALKEGWDNPNVFQICTLIEHGSPFTCRQKIGRGLRLCVNQNGERIEDEIINILHIISTESFAEFADKLQKEMEDLGIKFGILSSGMFVSISYSDPTTGETKKIDQKDESELFSHFIQNKYINKDRRINDTLRMAIATGTVSLPPQLEAAREKVIEVIKKVDKGVEIKPYKKQVSVKRKDELFESPEFTAIWNRMKQKTIFRMNMNLDLLHEKCIKKISEMEGIRPVRIRKEEAKLNIAEKGIDYTETRQRFADVEQEFLLPDILAAIASACKMPRREVGEILTSADRWVDFVNNPQQFIETVTAIINSVKIETMMEDGVKYTRLDGQEYTLYEVFKIKDEVEVFAFLDYNAEKVENSVYDYIIYDSKVESDFARALDNDVDVKLFFKIPAKFEISTPIGDYRPDWAVYYECDGERNLFFVIETKGTKDSLYLRGSENFKIACGEKHFKTIDSGVRFEVATNWREINKSA